MTAFWQACKFPLFLSAPSITDVHSLLMLPKFDLHLISRSMGYAVPYRAVHNGLVMFS